MILNLCTFFRTPGILFVFDEAEKDICFISGSTKDSFASIA